MDISLNISKLRELNLTISEYLYLRNLYVKEEDMIPWNDFAYIVSEIDEDDLQTKGFIKIAEKGNILRSKAIDLFESKELFYKFLSTFPIKTPSGRYLSPHRVEGLAVDKLKKKWDSLFKNKENLQEKAIKVLEAELAWRKKSGNLEYIHAMEAWLNGADFEKYEYLLDQQSVKKNDSM